MAGQFRRPSIRELGIDAYMAQFDAPNHPLGWGGAEFRYLAGQGVNMTNIRKAFNWATDSPVKERLAVLRDEQEKTHAKGAETNHTDHTPETS